MKRFIIASLISMCCFSVAATQLATFSVNSNSDETSRTEKKQDIHIISIAHVNRIVTPFKNPSIKLDNVAGVAYKTVGHVLYISTTAQQLIGGFITEQGDESVAIQIMLKPMDVAAQEIVLTGSNPSNGSELARRFERSSSRTMAIKEIMATLAKGDLPTGYVQKNVNASYIPTCKQIGLVMNFYNGQFVSGGDYVVSIGTVTNQTTATIEFKENNCYSEGVVSIAAHPSVDLLPSETSEVYVMFHRNKPSVRKVQKRQSLLGGGND